MISKPKTPSFLSQIFRGNTIYRMLFHAMVSKYRTVIAGRVLDIAGSRKAEYYRYLSSDLNVITVNIKGDGVDLIADFNRELPVETSSIDTVLLFNAIYIADTPSALMLECKRVLKPGGRLVASSPYISNEMRDPHDYGRLTSEGLERLVRESGMHLESIEPFGERFSSAAYLLQPFFPTLLLRMPLYALALALDRAVPLRVRKRHPAPLGYFFSART
jgi:SAM-dependent methyltransferase